MRNVRHCYAVHRSTPREISGGREERPYQKPFRKPGGKPFNKPFGKPGGAFRKPFGKPGPSWGAEQEARRPWAASGPAGERGPRRSFREERTASEGRPAGDEPSPHKGKFYERFVKPSKQASSRRDYEQHDDRRERGEERESRWLPSSERPMRIPSSASGRGYGVREPRRDQRPPRDDFRQRDEGFQGEPRYRSEAGERSDASSDYREGFRAGRPRREFEPRDEIRDRPRARSAPHLQTRVIRSYGAKADQGQLPPPAPEPVEAPVAKSREVAARVLLRRLHASDFVEDLLEDAFAATKMRPDDRRLTQELVYGCVRWQQTLDWLVARRTQDRPQLSTVQIFLRLGLYQLFFLDRIPPHAACYETVELAKQLGCGNQAQFINAILRRSDADREVIKSELAQMRETQPALAHSHPEWLVQKWTARWGAEDTRKLLEWNNTAPSTHVRVNTLKTTPTKLIERWRLRETVEYDLTPCAWAEEGHVLTLKSHPPLPAMGSFRDGWFYVQDPSTLVAVQALDAWAGESILDL